MNSVYKTNSKVIEKQDVKIFIKKSSKNISELFDYLKLRSFENIPNIIEKNGYEIKYEFINEIDKDYKNKHIELAKIISMLHYKTSYYKDVSKDKYREIYDKLSDKISFISEYYNNLINEIELETYPSPSHYLIARNFSIINGALNYSKVELKRWFKKVETKTKERVAVVHNNPKIEHLIKGDKYYLTNWDNYVVDTPILDLYKLYKENRMVEDFKMMYDEYTNNFSLTEEEKKMFFILISIPPKIEEVDIEIINTKNIKEIINSIYNSNKLISLIDFKKEVNN